MALSVHTSKEKDHPDNTNLSEKTSFDTFSVDFLIYMYIYISVYINVYKYVFIYMCVFSTTGFRMF